jgi:hypothetical protein
MRLPAPDDVKPECEVFLFRQGIKDRLEGVQLNRSAKSCQRFFHLPHHANVNAAEILSATPTTLQQKNERG